MSPKILVTGVTGYIGGDAFQALYEAHPGFDYVLVVRNKEREEAVRKQYADAKNVKIAYPGPDGRSFTDILEEESRSADIVLHTGESADDMGQATAILKGLQAAGRSAENPAYWIHISGTGILVWYDQAHSRHGQAPLLEQKYDDISGIDRILTLPDQAMHRDIDKLVLNANNSGGSGGIRTAIVAPPTIYGLGRGPVNAESKQMPALARLVLTHGYAPVVGEGKAEWDHVHVADLSSLLVSLVDAALKPENGKNPDIFGPRAYYFCQSGAHVWADVAVKVAGEAVRQGLLKEVVTKTVSLEEAVRDGGFIASTFGLNSKGVASRARRYLGWEPKGPSLDEEISRIVQVEGKRVA